MTVPRGRSASVLISGDWVGGSASRVQGPDPGVGGAEVGWVGRGVWGPRAYPTWVGFQGWIRGGGGAVGSVSRHPGVESKEGPPEGFLHLTHKGNLFSCFWRKIVGGKFFGQNRGRSMCRRIVPWRPFVQVNQLCVVYCTHGLVHGHSTRCVSGEGADPGCIE